MFTFHSESTDPYWNQALEEYLFLLPLEDDVLYLWENSEAVVYGCYQNPFIEIDLPLMWRESIPVVRRISGGGTVYHGPGNINYTWLTTPDYDGVDYARFLTPVVDALRSLGYPVDVRNDIDIYLAEAKISGSAQKRKKDRVLHHGTLLFDCDLERLKRSGPKNNERRTGKGVKSRPATVGNLISHEGGQSKGDLFERTAQYKKALQSALGLDQAEVITLSDDDLAAIARLKEEKYETWAWTYGDAPAFSYKHAFSLEESGTASSAVIDLRYEAKKGRVLDASIRCDGRLSGTLSESFSGLKLERSVLAAWCLEHFGSEMIDRLL